MRKLGYTLLLIGFVWLCVQQINGVLRAGLRHVVLARDATLSSDPAMVYHRDDVRDQIRQTALAAYDRFPDTLPPGVLMLLGGLLLARRPRRGDVAPGKSSAGTEDTSGKLIHRFEMPDPLDVLRPLGNGDPNRR